jgi:hypothetical protein
VTSLRAVLTFPTCCTGRAHRPAGLRLLRWIEGLRRLTGTARHLQVTRKRG